MIGRALLLCAVLLIGPLAFAAAPGSDALVGPDAFSLGDIFLPTVFPVGETAFARINVSCSSDEEFDDAFLVLNVTDPFGGVAGSRLELAPLPYADYSIPMDFAVPGRHVVAIGFESGGEYRNARTTPCLSVEPVMYEDWEDPTGWTFDGSGPSFGTVSGDVRSLSGGSGLGISTGPGAGFAGEMEASAESPPLDLADDTSGTLYVYHKRSFLGPLGSCGGLVQVVSGSGAEVVVPEGGYDSRLRDNMTGGFGGVRAFAGEDGWGLSTFDLSSLVGNEGSVRFTAVSDAEGYGNWTIDDVFIVLEGPEDTVPPGDVSGLRTTVQSDGSVLVEWNAPPDRDVTGYYLYLDGSEMTNLSGYEPYVTVLPDGAPEYTLIALEKGIEFWVAVAAFDASGNSDPTVSSVHFTVPDDGPNKAPVAVIEVEGGDPYRVGEGITLDGTASYDPEGDEITYHWTLPGGVPRLGGRITWVPEAEGSATIRLQARDRWGATNESLVDIEIEEAASGDGAIIKGDLRTFLLLMVPLAILLVIVVAIMSAIRSRRKRRLELDLEEVGIVHGPRSRAECSPGAGAKKVLDLRPVEGHERPRPRPHGHTERGAAKGRPVEGIVIPPPPVPPHKYHHDQTGTTHAHHPPARPMNVHVTLQCPCCGRSFREKVSEERLKVRDLVIKCPHCGSEGEL